MQFDKIKYTAKFSKGIYTELIFFQYYRRIGLILLTIGGIFAFVIVLGFLLSWNPLGFRRFPIFALLYALIVFSLPFILKGKISKTIDNHPLLDIPIDYAISSEGISISYSGNHKDIKWNQIYKISLHPKAWMIYGTKESFFYILKDELTKEQQQLFVKWAQAASKLA